MSSTRNTKFILLLIVSILIIGCSSDAVDWQDEIVYFILIDRFADGDPSNNTGTDPASYLPFDGSYPPALRHYQGGDLKGIIDNLDMLKGMGVTTLWISPFIDNSNTDYVGWWPYHGYHPIEFRRVDEHFGSLQDLKQLVEQVHVRNMRIIFDMPFNQVAPDHRWLRDPDREDWFHVDVNGIPFDITDWNDQDQIERGELHGLPDLAQENPDVYEYLVEISKYWITETGCDGFRLDAVKHIPLNFWKRYNREIKEFAGKDFLLLGEVFWGDINRIKPYQGIGFDALFDVPGYYAIRNAFAANASMAHFSDYIRSVSQQMKPELRATLIDNHDVARFNTDLGKDGWLRTKIALTWLLTSPGMPVIYYGTELGMTGAPVRHPASGQPQDYLNRRLYPDRPNIKQGAHKLYSSVLMKMRHNKDALRRGAFHEIYKDWSVYAFTRSLGSETYLVVLSTSSTREHLPIPVPGGRGLTSEPLMILGEGSARLMEDEIYLKLPPLSANIWQLDMKISSDTPQWTEFTDRRSGDFQEIDFIWFDKENTTEKIQIAGDFSNWEPMDLDVVRNADTLRMQIRLKPGRYEYKFVINDTLWVTDPFAMKYAVDPWGGRNGVVQVWLAKD